MNTSYREKQQESQERTWRYRIKRVVPYVVGALVLAGCVYGGYTLYKSHDLSVKQKTIDMAIAKGKGVAANKKEELIAKLEEQ